MSSEGTEYISRQLSGQRDYRQLADQWLADFSRVEAASLKLSPLPNYNPADLNKNRFNDIFTTAHRVKLSGASDYINADRCPALHDGETELILAQAPMQNTIIDFLKLLLEQQIRLVVCLIHCPSSTECYRNYVDFDGAILYRIDSELTAKRQFGKLTAHVYQATIQRKSTKHQLEIISLENWCDKTMPESLVDLIGFLQFVQAEITRTETPRTLIHCQAGVGRTGVAAVGLRMLQARSNGRAIPPVHQTLLEMREYRRKLVPSAQQFIGLCCLRAKLLPKNN